MCNLPKRGNFNGKPKNIFKTLGLLSSHGQRLLRGKMEKCTMCGVRFALMWNEGRSY
jgi:hypothetical protein